MIGNLAILKDFNWEYLTRIYGSSHSSIIGFISHEWLRLNTIKKIDAYVLDGAPSPIKGKRTGQVNADLVLLMDGKPKIIVEVETENLAKKAENLLDYFGVMNYENIAGLLVATKIKWDDKEKSYNEKDKGKLKEVEKTVNKTAFNLGVIEIRRKRNKDISQEDVLRRETHYYHWEIDSIVYWDKNNKEVLLYPIVKSHKC